LPVIVAETVKKVLFMKLFSTSVNARSDVCYMVHVPGHQCEDKCCVCDLWIMLM